MSFSVLTKANMITVLFFLYLLIFTIAATDSLCTNLRVNILIKVTSAKHVGRFLCVFIYTEEALRQGKSDL